MEYIDGKPVLDFDDCVKYIVKDTGYNSEIVESILDSETRYMMKVGIITEVEVQKNGSSAIKK